MSIVGLYLYDHRYSRPIDNIAGIQIDIFINQLNNSFLLTQQTSEASHIIGHFKTEEFNILLDGENSAPTRSSFQVIFCLTTEGLGFARDDHKKIDCTNGTTRYIFYVNQVDNMSRDEVLKAFYSMNKEQTQALLDCDYIRVPQAILSLFNLKIESLSALSLLCQGYLATNSKLADDIDSDNDPVNEALTKMGWNAFKNSGDYAAIVYADLLTKEKAEKTQDTNWWLSSFDKRAETAENLEQALDDKIRKAIVKEISNKVQKEWGEQDPNICHKDVCNFFIELEKETIENPDIVARAYLAISKRLEK